MIRTRYAARSVKHTSSNRFTIEYPIMISRSSLVCLGSDGGQGIISTELYVVDLQAPAPGLMAGSQGSFFATTDTTDTCGWMSDNIEKPDPLLHASIEKVAFKSVKGGVAAISVTAAYGERKMTREDVDICSQEDRTDEPRHLSFLPPTKRYQIDFFFVGGTYQADPRSAAAARVFNRR